MAVAIPAHFLRMVIRLRRGAEDAAMTWTSSAHLCKSTRLFHFIILKMTLSYRRITKFVLNIRGEEKCAKIRIDVFCPCS